MAFVFTKMFHWNSDKKGNKIFIILFLDVYIGCVTTICLIGIAVGSFGVGYLVNTRLKLIGIYGQKNSDPIL